MNTKNKGKIAELMVSAKLMEFGWTILNPLCEHTRYDIAAEKNGKFIRVQVKYVTPSKGTLSINCKSSNNWSTLTYTPEEIDIIAAFDSTNHKIYFIPASKLNTSSLKLRIKPSKNKQQKKINFAREFETLTV
jgi:Holliday junction resolvase-like predicted endonuclease